MSIEDRLNLGDLLSLTEEELKEISNNNDLTKIYLTKILAGYEFNMKKMPTKIVDLIMYDYKFTKAILESLKKYDISSYYGILLNSNYIKNNVSSLYYNELIKYLNDNNSEIKYALNNGLPSDTIIVDNNYIDYIIDNKLYKCAPNILIEEINDRLEEYIINDIENEDFDYDIRLKIVNNIYLLLR